MKRVVLDVETDGLNATKVWCIVTKDIDTGEVDVYRRDVAKDFERFKEDASSYSMFIAHNGLGFDYWVLRDLLAVDLDSRRCIDTLVASRLFNYNVAGGHSLEAWGQRLKCPKTDFHDYSQLTDEMVDYCKQDVEVTYKLFKFFESHINSEQWRASLRLEHDMAVICHELKTNGFKFDIAKAKDIYDDISLQVADLTERLQQSFLPKPCAICEVVPKATKSGSISRTDFRWIPDGDLTAFSVGAPFTRIEWIDFNPGSPQQVVERLNEAGWEPFEKTKGHKQAERDLSDLLRNGNGKGPEADALRARLETYKVYGWTISEENLETVPEGANEGIKVFVKWRMLSKRKQTLEEWFTAYRADTSCIHGSFSHIGTWTHRMSHNSPNMGNIPSIDSKYHSPELKELAYKYGKELRSCWTASEGKKLVGVDAEGIQLRILAHYMDDPEFTTALISGNSKEGTDVHSLNAERLGLGASKRPRAKTFIYAWLLGAGIPKVSKILGYDTDTARRSVDSFIESYPGLRRLKDIVIPNDAARGYIVGLDGRLVKVPSEHQVLAAYLQAGEAVVMKRANVLWKGLLDASEVPYRHVNFVHDEWEVECNEEDQEFIGETMKQAIVQTGIDLGLKCPLAGNAKYGETWFDVH